MIRILFIYPYPELKEAVLHILDLPMFRDIISADMRLIALGEEPAIDFEQYDAVIARGYTWRHIQTLYPPIPIIELNISEYDIFQTILESHLRIHAHRIAVFGFYGDLSEPSRITELLGCSIKTFPTPEYSEALSEMISEAAAEGFDAVVGGYSVYKYASAHHIPAFLIQTGENTIIRALQEAVGTVEQLRRQNLRTETYKTIIHSSRDGILFVDADGRIEVSNQALHLMNGAVNPSGRTLKEAFPPLFSDYMEVVRDGRERVDRLVSFPKTKLKASASFRPVVVDRVISGVVITLSDVTRIQQMESQIRKKLNERGLYAKYHFQDIIHNSAVIDRLILAARKCARSDSNIFLVGESGTGKELFAQSIHNESMRSGGPFVAINCAALPDNLLESELFGYTEGAFTGATKGGKAGVFELAHNGTLFLDEIGEMPLSTQTKLLRVLQERQVRRIGDDRLISINVRIISATNRNLQELAESERFRRDLLYRLDVLRLYLPPLRERGSDVETLFLFFLEQMARKSGIDVPAASADVLSLLQGYPFYGNIRELQNVAERICVFGSNPITIQDLQNALQPQDVGPLISSEASAHFSDEEEYSNILTALEICHNNKSRAAKILGMDRSTLWRKLKRMEERKRG